MNPFPFPFPNADRELRLAWVADVDAALNDAEGLLRSSIPLSQRMALKVDIAHIRAGLAAERAALDVR
ncbi:MAG: hypothetical protein JWO15_627 [Sphingomonadales bacterium]|nr:hypothetical protein [Sphingomonadales bacterium]